MSNTKTRYYEIEAQRDVIEAAWRKNGGNTQKTATELGMSDNTLRNHLQAWGLRSPKALQAKVAKRMTVSQLAAAIDKGFSECTTYEGIRGYWLGLRAALGSMDADSQGS